MAIAPPARNTDHACPTCGARPTLFALGSAEALPWCEACGWNAQSSAKHLRRAGRESLQRSVPVILAGGLLFYSQTSVMIGLLVVGLGLGGGAWLRHQAYRDVARVLEARVFPEPERPKAHRLEPELLGAAPRGVKLRSQSESLRGMLTALRLQWAWVFVLGLLALTPLARWAGPRVQLMALLLGGVAILLLLGTSGRLLVMLARHRYLTSEGMPLPAEVSAVSAHLRRERDGAWRLISRLRYRVTDARGIERHGEAMAAGAIAPGDRLTVLISPRDPGIHLAYVASRYRAEGDN